MLDYIIIHQKDRLDVQITHCMREADCSSDHQLICSKIHIQLARKSKTARQKPHRGLNLSRLLENISVLEEKVKEMLVSTAIVVMDPGDGLRDYGGNI